MSQRYYVLSGESAVLPITDGTLLTEDISVDYENCVFVVAFYDAQGDAVTPSAGTIKPEMSPIKGQWQEPSSGDITIDATKCIAGLSTYAIPTFDGPTELGRLTFAGITGAASATAYFWRS